MNDYVVHHPDSYIAMPWRNGLGQTLEVAKQNPASGSEFAWRLSIADVSNDGAFSNFSGYERTLLLLEGAGITLAFEDGRKSVLTEPLQAASFCGAEQTVATLHAGPIKDFNVMCRADYCNAAVSSSTDTAETVVDVHAGTLLLYAVGERLTIAGESVAVELQRRHLLRADKPDTGTLRVSGGEFICVQITYR